MHTVGDSYVLVQYRFGAGSLNVNPGKNMVSTKFHFSYFQLISHQRISSTCSLVGWQEVSFSEVVSQPFFPAIVW